MTPAEADKRIMHSRRVINGYKAGGTTPGTEKGTLVLLASEKGVLQQIATALPDKRDKIDNLIGDIEVLMEAFKAKMH